jgi:bifunctional DNA-binding transcriptional regulator/antitoxin component of YhaV-PrlF toxin-antitoxin module
LPRSQRGCCELIDFLVDVFSFASRLSSPLLFGYSLLMPRRVKRRRGFTRLSPKRQITLPLAVVEQAGIRVGEELAVEADDDGRVIVSRPNGEMIGDRRRRALDRAAGALPGVWPAGALDELRDEWR